MKHILRVLAIIPALLLILMLGAAPVSAADVRSGDTIIVASGDQVNDDLYVAASRIVINGTVNGDVICAGETIVIDGVINGNIIAVGSTIRIDGEVTDSVRAAGATIVIGGKVGKDIFVAGNDINLKNVGAIGRDLFFASSSINVDVPIDRNIKGYAETADLNSLIRGNVEVGATNLTISSTASIKGNLTYVSANEAVVNSGAQIEGTVAHNLPKAKSSVSPNLSVWFKIIAFLTTLVTGALIILIAPKRASAVAESIKRKPLATLGWGALILFVTPLAALITFITVIGIPVGLIGLLLYGSVIYLSQVAVGLFIGSLIIGRFATASSRGVLVGAFTLGFAILTLIKLIPYIGFPIWLATALFGIGAIVLSQKTGDRLPDSNIGETPTAA